MAITGSRSCIVFCKHSKPFVNSYLRIHDAEEKEKQSNIL